jgi:glycosyltransferase involved in cell wall biosynthesis
MAIFAWNEERAIPRLLESLLPQSIFAHLAGRHLKAEVVCVLNGCTDRTAEVASEIFAKASREDTNRGGWTGRVKNLTQRGKINAWNQYVHSVSAPGARYLFMMDADIRIHPPDTLLNMLRTLEQDTRASVAVDAPRKDIAFKKEKALADRISLDMSRMTSVADGQLCGQLYCIRSEIARRIYLPKDLPACEDGFIKALVCTEFLEHDIWQDKVKVAPDAAHTFEAYTTPREILNNQKRQIIGQTAVHILVDKHLVSLPASAREDLPGTFKEADAADPLWLKRLIAGHLKQTRYFWRLYPGLLTQRFKHLANLSWPRRLLCLPAAIASVVVGLLAAWMAWRSIERGAIDYWPKANRNGLSPASTTLPPKLSYSTSIQNPD